MSIHAVERFLGDMAIAEGLAVSAAETQSGKRRVLIIGAGPSGLSAAYHLARLGHAVTIYEAGPDAGGMMNFGIPAYRLPRNVLRAEIERIEELGVKITLNRKVTDLVEEKQTGISTPSLSRSGLISERRPIFRRETPARSSTPSRF